MIEERRKYGQSARHILYRGDCMSHKPDMEVTEERAGKIKTVLKELYEDQYDCKLIQVTKKGRASVQKPKFTAAP
jgi:hypothetical protein